MINSTCGLLFTGRGP